jgi:hypothetical protein
MAPSVSLAQTSNQAAAPPQENKTAAPAQENQAAQASQDNKTPAAPQNLPNAPSSASTEPSLTDLGFPAEQTQGDAKQQALLDKRPHMLKIHQRMGLITTIPLIVTVATSLITAYYAIRAPRVPGTETRGPIRFHKAIGLDTWPRNDPDPHPGNYRFRSKEQRRKGSRHCFGTWAGGHRDGWGIRGRALVGVVEVLS